MVFYESPMRLIKTLEEFIEYFGPDRQCSVSRELTKMFEETKRGTLHDVCFYFSQKNVKGEIVIVLEGVQRNKKHLSTSDDNETDYIQR